MSEEIKECKECARMYCMGIEGECSECGRTPYARIGEGKLRKIEIALEVLEDYDMLEEANTLRAKSWFKNGCPIHGFKHMTEGWLCWKCEEEGG